MSAALATLAPTDLDPFGAAFLADPYPYHAALRDAGPVVRLDRYGVYACARHEEVHAALSDHATFCSGAGVGISDLRREAPWRPQSIILEADPPLHTRSRAVIARILAPAALRTLKETFEAEAERMVAALAGAGPFDAMRDLAEAYPSKVFGDAVGLQADGRENLLAYGGIAFNAFGPRNALFTDAMARLPPVAAWIMDKCSRAKLAPGGFGARIFEAADAGEIEEAEAAMLVRSFLTAGVDTTVNGIGNALFCFAVHPAQWDRLRAEPALARAAFDEVLRFESPVQAFFRTSTRATDLGGVPIAAGEKLLVFFAAANRDPRRWDEPDRFDVTRRPAGHVAFGAGIHGCVGQMIARMEGEAVLGALIRNVARIGLAGEPVRRFNNTLRGLASLPLVFHPA